MAQFMLLYDGPATDPADMSPEQQTEVMNKWAAWMGGLGKAMLDMGNPMGDGVSIADNGAESDASPLNGYSIVEAADLAAAKGLVDGHPFLSDSDGKFKVQVFELLPVPM
jgi:hypothetical protein